MLSTLNNWLGFNLRKIITLIELFNGVSPSNWLLSFFGIIAIRVFIEKIAQKLPNDSGQYLITFYLQNFLFFAIVLTLLWLWLSFLLAINPRDLSGLFFWGSWLIILPPLIDMIKTGGDIYWSFYLLNDLADLWVQYYTIFGHLPAAVIYFGTKITFVLIILTLTFFVYFKTRSFLKSIVNLIISYTIVFFMGSFPSWFSFFYLSVFERQNIFQINEYNILGLLATTTKIFSVGHNNIANALSYKLNLIFFCFLSFLLTVLFWKINRQKMLEIRRHYFPYSSAIGSFVLFLAGLWLGLKNNADNLNLNVFSVVALLCFLIAIACLSAITRYFFFFQKNGEGENEKFSATNQILPWLFFFSLAGLLVINVKFFLLAAVYLFALCLFSRQAYDLMRHIPLAREIIFLLGSFMLLFSGYILGQDQSVLENFPWRIALFLVFSFFLFFELAKLNQPQIGGEVIWKIPCLNNRLILAVVFFAFFPISVFLMNEIRLFWPSLVIGSIAFWLIISRLRLFEKNTHWFLFLLIVLFFVLLFKYLS